ncbi:hypothetical protein BH24CHL4_BH24CHL4_11050 [soil metagenome]
MDSTAQLVLDIHRHSRWANGKLLDAAEHLAPEQLRTPIGEGGYGDLLETLLHMYDAQKTWLDRARIGESGPSPEIADYPDIPALRDAWEALDADMDAYLAGQDETALVEEASYRSFYGSEGTYARTDMMLHQAFHSHQHRCEVALVLTQLGHSPGELDYGDYVDIRDGAN